MGKGRGVCMCCEGSREGMEGGEEEKEKQRWRQGRKESEAALGAGSNKVTAIKCNKSATVVSLTTSEEGSVCGSCGCETSWHRRRLGSAAAAHSKLCILKWALWSVVRTFLCSESLRNSLFNTLTHENIHSSCPCTILAPPLATTGPGFSVQHAHC